MNDQLDLLAQFGVDNGIMPGLGNTSIPAPSMRREPSSPDGLVLPAIRSAGFFRQKPPPLPPELITGILHEGSKLVLGGSSKSFKTWTLIDMAISVASGETWWGWKTVQRRSIYLNFEIQEGFFWKRIQDVCDAKSIEVPEITLDIWNLRGYAADINALIAGIIEKTRCEGYGLIVVDPVYKLMGGRDENSAGDIGTLMNALEQLAVKTGAAVVFGAHFAKGNAAAKESIDRISGSGVFARDPDSIITLTQHDNKACYAVDSTLRNFAPVEPFVVKWDFPLMTRQRDLDPKKLKQVGGRQKQYDAQELLLQLQEPQTTTEWLNATKTETGMSDSQFHVLKRELLASNRIVNHPTQRNRWIINPSTTPNTGENFPLG